MATTASDVAKYLLAKADEEDELLTHLKLQKLLYYVQGFHLAIRGKCLFPEPILAWAHGPVVREVWNEYRDFENKTIPPPDAVPEIPPKKAALVDEVWRVYGQFTAWRLRQMSHDTAPWGETERNEAISHKSMTQFFKTQLTKG
jgi:uncharacterized phage-associated protein